MPSKTGDYKIPFDEHGNQVSYPGSWMKIEWRENTPFRTTLKFEGFYRGRSAANANMRTDEGVEVQMFLKDFGEALPFFEKGKLTGEFKFVKRGQNYGIMFIHP